MGVCRSFHGWARAAPRSAVAELGVVRRSSRHVKTRTKRILWLTPLAIAAAYAVAFVSLRSEPSGYVASYSIIPHDSNDVLDFSHGIVTQRTCCGDESWGTYSRSPDGTWLWHIRHGSKNHATNDIIVRPGFFSMSFADTQDPAIRFTLRRRVFKQFPL